MTSIKTPNRNSAAKIGVSCERGCVLGQRPMRGHQVPSLNIPYSFVHFVAGGKILKRTSRTVK